MHARIEHHNRRAQQAKDRHFQKTCLPPQNPFPPPP
jgi:hypothetical protein